MFESISRSILLIKESFNVLRKDKELILFPIISSTVTLMFFIFLGVSTYMRRAEGFGLNYYLFFFFYLLASYFVVIFFNSGLISCAHMRLNGKDPKFSDGIRAASKNVWKILAWALISAIVGTILKSISNRSSGTAKAASSILQFAWSLLTFFVIPIIVVEGLGVFKAIKKSEQLFVKTWGENVAGRFSIGVFFVVLGVLGLIPFGLSLLTKTPVIIIAMLALLIIYWIILSIISSSLKGIFVAALYNYATKGKMPSSYSPEVIKGAFAKKGTMKES
ncbi:MAG: DUF6159 family protein [Candidatus Woesearchaeota archaeon]